MADCADMLELHLDTYRLKLRAPLIRKVMQTLYAERPETASFLRVAWVMARAQEKDTAFWTQFEEYVRDDLAGMDNS